MTIKIITAILTGIGGHYLNRRWDKAILFLCLFMLYGVAVYIFSMFSYQNVPLISESVADEFNEIARRTSMIFVFGEMAIWLVSIVITAIDSKRNSAPVISRWTISGIAGATTTTVFSFFLLASTGWTLMTINKNPLPDSDKQAFGKNFKSTNETSFHEGIYFGGSPSNPFKLPPAPRGEGILTGRITYNGDPAVGITLSVVLNSKYKAKDIETDSDGVFVINLPTGRWTINSIQATKWENKPKEGSITFYYGGEEKLTGDKYHRYGFGKKNGFPVDVTDNLSAPHINITINDDVDMLFPDPDNQNINATIEDSIKWNEYPNVDRYYIEMHKVTHEGSTTHYKQVASKVVSGVTSIPLSSFNHIKSKDKGMAEYSVNLYAFSDDGTLIAESKEMYQGGTFRLTDGNVFIEENLDDQFNLSSIKDTAEFEKKYKAIFHEEQRATAVLTLIDENMIEEAESLLNKMDSEYSQGKKEALSGYIHALKRECQLANELFEKASTINPKVCIPDRYRAKCL